ncbi:hypothetical protein GH714_002441 [Hevea brasiliensis]|uniref:Shikimate dehydrogenase substrate binding N-terminal domain-containing protein n=1 Tax=Hevea brasiliensis TaxID=3981 RepID=A0A6A6KFM8_HEVBR|nr:hypothetical protein GH714_002441 [Hevea brasiliensis]
MDSKGSEVEVGDEVSHSEAGGIVPEKVSADTGFPSSSLVIQDETTEDPPGKDTVSTSVAGRITIISSSLASPSAEVAEMSGGGRGRERKNPTLICAPIMAESVDEMVAREFNDFLHGNKAAKCKVIVSSHNYHNTPSVEELGNLVAKIQAAGADIVKIATAALDITDVSRIFHITVHSQVPIIGIVMGEKGLISRILCAKFGGYLTFGTLESGIVSAPGQPTIKDLLDLYNFRQIGPDTKVHGIVRKPIGHSKSPFLYNEAFKSIGFNGVFVHLLVDDIAKFFQTFSSTDFAGFSCTIPHKEAAVKCRDEVDPVAKVSIGAVNCIIRRQSDGKLLGYNTDYVVSQNISSVAGSPLAGKLFVVIGAGGAGKALAYGAKEKGARVLIANCTFDRAKELAETVEGDAISLADLDTFHPENGMILANTTSIGMQPKIDETPISKPALRHYSLVFDAV